MRARCVVSFPLMHQLSTSYTDYRQIKIQSIFNCTSTLSRYEFVSNSHHIQGTDRHIEDYLYSYENSTGKVNTHNRLHLLAIFFDCWHVVHGTGILQTRRACIQFISIYCDPFSSLMLIVEYTLLIQINTCIKYVKKGQFTKQSTIH